MITTSASLLSQLRRPGESEAWVRFVRLYSPLLYAWARKLGLTPDDAADLVQDVFAGLVQKLPRFEYDGRRRFRGWLWTVTRNCWRDRARRAAIPVDLRAEASLLPDSDRATDAVDAAEFARFLTAGVVPVIRAQFHESTWNAFWRHVVEGQPAAEVALELGLTTAAVYKAKVRVLARLHRELGDLIEGQEQP